MDGEETLAASREAYKRFFNGEAKVFSYIEMEHAFKSGAEWMKDRIMTIAVRVTLMMLSLLSVLIAVYNIIS